MSELKAGVIVTPHDEGMCFDRGSDVMAVTERETEFYLKSEADKVIAELIEKNKRLSDDCLIKASNTFREIEKEIRHHKYKRCLAMADYCSYKAWYYKYNGKEEIFYRWMKFRRVWAKLAEKFKETK